MSVPTDEAALLRAICDEPESDDVRLVYADWLDDHGRHEQAGYVRAAVADAALGKAGSCRGVGFEPPDDLVERVGISFDRGLPAVIRPQSSQAIAELFASDSSLARLPTPATWKLPLGSTGLASALAGLAAEIVQSVDLFSPQREVPLLWARQYRRLAVSWSDEDTAVLAALPGLRRLRISVANNLTDAGLAPLGNATALRELSVDRADGLTGEFLRHVPDLRRLDWIGLGTAGLTRRFPLGLESLRLCGHREPDALAGLAPLARLRSLTLAGGDGNLTGLPPLPSLESLALHEPNAVLRLHELPQLAFVRTLADSVTRLDFRGLTALRTFVVGGPNLTDSGLAGIAGAVNLADLTLSDAPITSRGLAALNGCPTLESLTLNRCGLLCGTRPGVGRLRSVRLSDCRELVALESFAVPSLVELHVERCNALPDDALAALAGLPALRSLTLAHCAGLTDDAAPYLAALTGLERLELKRCRGIRKFSLTRLRRSLPDCEVIA